MRMHHSLRKQDINTQVLGKEEKRVLSENEIHELIGARNMMLLTYIYTNETWELTYGTKGYTLDISTTDTRARST